MHSNGSPPSARLRLCDQVGADAARDLEVARAHLVDVVVDDAKLPELLHLPRDVVELVQVDGQRRLVDDGLHAGHPEAVVVGVVEAGIHHAVLAEAEDLPVHQRADLSVADGADEALALQVDRLQHARRLVVGEADPRRVVQDLRQLVLGGGATVTSVQGILWVYGLGMRKFSQKISRYL